MSTCATQQYSRRQLQAAATFGLTFPQTHDSDTGQAQSIQFGYAALTLDVSLVPGEIGLITGPSGSGKSMLLRRYVDATACAVVTVDPRSLEYEDRSGVDLIDRPMRETLGLLARAGLGEAAVFTRPARWLSDGQRFRLALAVAMHEAMQHRDEEVVIVIDELCNALDRTTAMCVCATLSKWVKGQQQVKLVAATAHEDVVDWLDCDVHIRLPVAVGCQGIRCVRQRHAAGTQRRER